MRPYQTFLVGIGTVVLFAAFFGTLIVLLTRGQRRLKREIRQGARRNGWSYRRRHWQGSSIDFHLEGRTRAGLHWIINSGSMDLKTRTGADHPVQTLTFHVPELGGEVDLAVMPKKDGMETVASLAHGIPGGMLAGLARFSSNAADAMEFLRGAQESPLGRKAFDDAFQVLVKAGSSAKPLITPAIADPFLQWPPQCAAPHSVLAWRDGAGLHLQVRLPSQPTWNHVEHLQVLGEDLCAALPPPAVSSRSQRPLDRLAGWAIKS